jgi:hypothetical protein
MTDRWRIKINNAGTPFFYTCEIVDDKDEFLYVRDVKEGLIKINKACIISMQNLGDK